LSADRRRLSVTHVFRMKIFIFCSSTAFAAACLLSFRHTAHSKVNSSHKWTTLR